MSNPAVFLDRDGTLMEDVDYCNDPRKVFLYEGTPDALSRLKANGFKTIIITNQSGLARGKITEKQYKAVHAKLIEKLGEGKIDAAYFCPDFSERRKPSPVMVFEAARDFDIDLARSFFIGDKAVDIECGRNAGTRTILVETGYGKTYTNCGADFIAKDLPAAVDCVLQTVMQR